MTNFVVPDRVIVASTGQQWLGGMPGYSLDILQGAGGAGGAGVRVGVGVGTEFEVGGYKQEQYLSMGVEHTGTHVLVIFIVHIPQPD